MTPELQACSLCGHAPLAQLPVPQPDRSMLSDGRIWPAPLRKLACPSCGLICHAGAVTDASVREFYNADYSLGAAPGTSDLLRNVAYAGFVSEFLSRVTARRVLEVGSGSGQVLARLADQFPEAEFVGLEAAEQLSSRQTNKAGVIIQHGFVEDLPPADPFDFVYSINVIEHAADPARFLRAIRCQLAQRGRALVICPANSPPNLELVFQDHVSSFSQRAFSHLAMKAGLCVLSSFPRLEAFPGFQAFLLGEAGALGGQERNTIPHGEGEQLPEITTYLQGWQRLDGTLLSRIGASSETRIFGAGEIAALLRCYAPRFWHTVQAIVVDETVGCRDLGLPVVPTHQLQPDSKPLVVAVHPRAQETLSKRLRAIGFDVVQFDDVIPR